MKRLLIVLAGLVAMAGSSFALDAKLEIPNLEATEFYSFDTHEVVLGATSRFAYVGDLEARLGFYNNTSVVGLSYDLINLDKLGINVHYAWETSFDLTCGIGAGMNFQTNKISMNVNLIMIQIGLK